MDRKGTSMLVQPRGRPPAKASKHVFQDLMDAFEEALKTRTANEVTTKDISIAAGSNEAMIKYYFGGKDGLLVAMLDDMMRHTAYSAAGPMSRRCLESRSIAPLVEELAQAWSSRPNLVHMIMAELLQASSKVKKAFIDRYSHHTPRYVIAVVEAMQSAGVYRPDVDPRFAAFSIISLILGPVSLSSAADMMGFENGLLNDPKWVYHVTRTIDASLS